MSLRRVARDCPVIAPRGCAGILRRSGVREVVEVDEGDRVDAGGILVQAVPALHDGRRYPVGPPVAALGFLLEASTRMYFAGDTDLFDGMAELEGRVDLAALPIWGWGPRIPAGHLDPESAAHAAALIRPEAVLPIHWGTLRSIGAQRDTDPMAPVHRFVAAIGRVAPQTEVRVLAPGERLSLAARSTRSSVGARVAHGVGVHSGGKPSIGRPRCPGSGGITSTSTPMSWTRWGRSWWRQRAWCSCAVERTMAS